MRRSSSALVVIALALPLMSGCAGAQTPAPPASSAPITSREAVRAADFYMPDRGPLRLDEARGLPAPAEAPLKAAVYVGECATPWAWPKHIAYLQSLGLAVVVPRFGGDRCVAPGDHLGTMHGKIDLVRDELVSLPWIDAEQVFLVGHGAGADVASTYTRDGTFKGLVGLAAACPFGVQKVTPMLTFRALDDRVLANRGTRCTQYSSPNALHIEFAGNDHVLALDTPAEPGGARALMRDAIAAFMDAGGAAGAGAPTAGTEAVEVAPASAPPGPVRDAPVVD